MSDIKGETVSKLTNWDCFPYIWGVQILHTGVAYITDGGGTKTYFLGVASGKLGIEEKGAKIQEDANRDVKNRHFYPYFLGDCPWAIFQLSYIKADTKVRISV